MIDAHWAYHHPTRSFPFHASADLASARVVAGGRDKLVHCLFQVDGRAAWTFRHQSRTATAGARPREMQHVQT
jgi:hypothetical protein